MQKYIFQVLESSRIKKDKEKDPFMLFATPYRPSPLFTQQDLDQSYHTGYVQGKSASLTELQEEIEFQKTESLKTIVHFFSKLLEENQENFRLFYKNILQVIQKILHKLLQKNYSQRLEKNIVETFETLIAPLCQQPYLQIALHPQIQEKIEDTLKQAFERAGGKSPLHFLTNPHLNIAEVHLQWPEGSAVIDYDKLESSLENLLTVEYWTENNGSVKQLQELEKDHLGESIPENSGAENAVAAEESVAEESAVGRPINEKIKYEEGALS